MCVNRLRRTLLEIWIVLPLACIVGFMGPFGTYLTGDFIQRSMRWWGLLMGAYVLVRPTMALWAWVARATRLPPGTVMIWGLAVSSIPMGLFWQWVGANETRSLGGYTGMLPFALLCSLTILLVAALANRADEHLLRTYGNSYQWHVRDDGAAVAEAVAPVVTAIAAPVAPSGDRPRLYDRLSPSFAGPVVALESEDHYVRVHGQRGSELVLMRLRDAIAEMDGAPGEQTHRSWWVAQGGIAEVSRTGRSLELLLGNGARAPVARDSVDRLERSGFLPGPAQALKLPG